ncbi:MAG: imidazolonepropionase [Candidatus Brocadiae bacterium]|nr:imidazolonepropionase [Candidatus Brocadiia bacterium]
MNFFDLVVYNIGELVTMDGADQPRTGKEMANIGVLENAAILVDNGKIVAVSQDQNTISQWQAKEKIDAMQSLVTPGFVDPHTHPVFAASREKEFCMRIRGVKYEEIAKKGGGIRNSARKLRETPKNTLRDLTRKRLNRFLALGTTTIEAKSGYGLSYDSEIASLEVLAEIGQDHALDIVPTFMGAHEIPDEYRSNREEYIRIVIDKMIPEVARRKLAKYCDVFCETHVFTLEETKRILQAAHEHGLLSKLHADELSYTGGAELAASLKATSAEHLVAISDKGIEEMAKEKVIAVLLPATTFFLGSSRYAPARKMIDAGVAIALSTDFNPGSSMTQSMPIVLTIAGLYLRMTPEEALTASTINAACAIGKEKEVGSIVPGKQADFLIWQASHYEYLPYHFGDNLLHSVFKKGKIVYQIQ